ncbi:MAG: nucleotide sugar dehydrogenase [Candidatus Algichlamydia australiensis]|nr:nucleotide sugar dehydrogenase [Chlamydiales bacterium]
MFKQISLLGLGHIGLPTALLLACSGFSVHGTDCNPEVVERLLLGKLSYPEKGLRDLLLTSLSNGSLTISQQTKPAEVVLVAVPTPLGPNCLPDLSSVYQAIDATAPFLDQLKLLIIESTCPIGTTDTIAKQLRKISPNLAVAYCPERVLPGNILEELLNNDRVVGGVDKNSSELAAKFYHSFVRGSVGKTDARTAEAVKLAENSFRDLNIAFANELSMIADELNFDTEEVITLANRHPRVNILQPGVGVGGHCLPVDPYFIISSVPEQANMMREARRTNEKKTEWVIQKVRDEAKKHGVSTIACFGQTYKPGVSDFRGSPAAKISDALENDFDVLRVDPFLESSPSVGDAVEKADLLLGLVAHKDFRQISSEKLRKKIVLDFMGVFS